MDHLDGEHAVLQNVFSDQTLARPDHVLSVDEGRGFTYGEVEATANQLAHALSDECGIRPGDCIGAHIDNGIAFFYAMLAAHRLRAVLVPLGSHLSREELGYQIRLVQCRALLVDTKYAASIGAMPDCCQSVREVIAVQPTPTVGWPTLAEYIAGRSTERPAQASHAAPEDLALVMYTSGTTAHPKGVMLTQGNLTTAALVEIHQLQWCQADRYLHFLPMYNVGGGVFSVAPTIYVGATLVLTKKFSASRFGQLLCDEDISLCMMNAATVRMVMMSPETPADRSHRAWRMKFGLTLPSDEMMAFERRFGTRLCPTYGSSEGLISIFGACFGPRRLGSAGRVVPGYEVRLVDPRGSEVPLGMAGEAQVRSEQRYGISPGYYGDVEATGRARTDGWLITGDVLRFDAAGYAWFVERATDMIKHSGFNVAPAEVERVIKDHPGVEDAAVVGVPDRVRQEAIVAFVKVASGWQVGSEDVLKACRTRLSTYKVPQFITIVDELPVNALGKVQRRELRTIARELYGEGGT
jgi:carnitine-CoA ligase